MSPAHQAFRRRALSYVAAIAALVGAVVIATAVRPGATLAQDATPALSSSTSTVTVVGHGTVTVKPDVAKVLIGVDVVKPTIAEAQVEATQQMTSVINALKEAGIAEDDVQTAYYSVYVMRNYDPTGTPAEITGFQITNQVNVTVRDLTQLGALLESVIEAGANTIYGITFSVADTTAAASQARALAVQDAQRRAQELAQAAGLSLGSVIAISEGLVPLALYGLPGAEGRGAGAPVPVETGVLEVTIDVQVTYELV